MWQALLDLSQRQPEGWTLIGAQMVALHGFEHHRIPPRSSIDADVLVNVRLLQDGTERLSRLLLEAGFELAGMSADEVGHRFRSDQVEIDVLAPDGLGPRANVHTVPPAHTVLVPGGTQALERTELAEVSLEEKVGVIPRPSLLGAILLKARAIEVDDVPSQQRQDLAFLLSLVIDPRILAHGLKPRERLWLKRQLEMMDSRAIVWRSIDGAESGYSALRILAGR
jgi:hypothetical protein